jgi:hypothetical protein
LAAGISVSLAMASPAWAVDGAAIVRGAGQIKPEHAKEWRDLATADIMTAGVSVQAAVDQPLEMNLPDGVSITLEPSSRVQWMPASKLPSEINKWTRGYCIVLEDGELEVRMPPAPKGAHAFLVSTKAGTLTDWRGQLHVRVHGDVTSAAIYEGALVVGSNGQGFPVYDGAGILMHRGINPDKTKGIPAAPEWDDSSAGGFLVQSEDAPGALSLAWKAVHNAETYRIEIATDPTMVRVVRRDVSKDLGYATTQASGAAYWAHVRAVSPEGIVGQWSAPRHLRVLRYALPDGGTVGSDGAIVLPRGKSLTLLGAEGLEVAFENVTGDGHLFGASPRQTELFWFPLVGTVRLPDHASMRVMHVRDPATGARARLVVVCRQLRADVFLSPVNARWPGDPIDVRVTLTDPSGRIDVATEPVNVQAMLDLSPIGVAWHRAGNTWTGRILPRLIATSTVVRVVVTDSAGVEIGRGFVELEPSLQASR